MTRKHDTPDDVKVMIRTQNLSISSKSEINRMGYEEIRELGILHEINRLFLHPLGLTLAIMIPTPDLKDEDRDEEHFVGLMYMIDDRDDPEGTIFAETALDQEKIDKFEAFRRARWRERQDRLGFVIQPEEEISTPLLTENEERNE